MRNGAATVLQFTLPFEGLQDRIRAAAENGQVLLTARARETMRPFDVSDILVERALRRCQIRGRARPGAFKGDWQCCVEFNVKGFRRGGSMIITFSEGRLFVEDFRWEDSHD